MAAGQGMPDDISGPSGDGATAKANAVYQTYLQDIRNADGTGEKSQLCLDAADELGRVVGESDDSEETQVKATVDAYLSQLSDAVSGMKRGHVREVYQEKRDEVAEQKRIENGEAVVFTELVVRTLTGVTKKVTTDKSSTEETEFVLKFDDDNGTRLTVTQSTLFEGRALWKAYTAAQDGEYPERVESEEVEWDNWIGGVLEDVGEEIEEEPGPRTAALQALENYVGNTTSYGNRTDAVEDGGVYVDDEPPANSEVVVPREAIASITNTHEITDRALQAEISARELTGPSTGGDKVAQSTTLNGNWQTFWYLDGGEFDVDVGAYKEEAEDPIDRMDPAPGDSDEDGDDDGVAAGSGDGDDGGNDGDDGDGVEIVNDSDDDSDDDTLAADPDGEEDAAPGRMGSYGGGE